MCDVCTAWSSERQRDVERMIEQRSLALWPGLLVAFAVIGEQGRGEC